jgi:hypothetical protein
MKVLHKGLQSTKSRKIHNSSGGIAFKRGLEIKSGRGKKKILVYVNALHKQTRLWASNLSALHLQNLALSCSDPPNSTNNIFELQLSVAADSMEERVS